MKPKLHEVGNEQKPVPEQDKSFCNVVSRHEPPLDDEVGFIEAGAKLPKFLSLLETH